MCGLLALSWKLAEESLWQKELGNSELGTALNSQEHCILGSPTTSPFPTNSRVPFPVPMPRPSTSTQHT